MQVLVVEDDEKLAKSIRAGLLAEGYSVTLAHTAEDALQLTSRHLFDAILLDVMLPGLSGLQLLAALRQNRVATPVLMVTAKDTVEDRVRGLDSGADDYLIKPFALPELLARLRALLRRGKPDNAVILRCANLEIDTVTHTVKRDGVPVALTLREFEILEYLCRNRDRVVSREMLARDVWKEPSRHTPLDNVIDVHIAHLRRKLDDAFTPKLLHTVRGVGFILKEAAA
ncbi:MAG: response regulator transcription factor [Terriglobales bacterium]